MVHSYRPKSGPKGLVSMNPALKIMPKCMEPFLLSGNLIQESVSGVRGLLEVVSVSTASQSDY